MKVSYLIPENSYLFFRQIIGPIKDKGIEVYINKIQPDTDLVLVGILPGTPNWHELILDSRLPLVAWHWDLYSFVNLQEKRWEQFLQIMENQVSDIWSCTYEVARQLKEKRELDSYMMPSWVDVEEIDSISRSKKDFVFYAASSDAFGKRRNWAERACTLENKKLVCSTHQKLIRSRYMKFINSCRVYVMPAFEESNGTIPAQEAAVAGAALVMSDLPATKEIFGNTVYYFQPNDFEGLRRAINKAWEYGPRKGCRERIVSNYGLPKIADRIVERLDYVHSRDRKRTQICRSSGRRYR